ncbi:hypothetical protein PsorP6_013396 [Peronosclerospora sorghi]|uniref:Uncharacterized protein n=1 Tax=Peronosclerospora sorghi TaxID=230839 RepID=A0ACC0WFG5_9STRA|nr:hypothetical protein PsorP6_013396 [Peronosclerospora sorghi]
MGCCLSREDDPFDSGREALLLKDREKMVDADPQKKDVANGNYKSTSAVAAAGDSTSVPTKPEPVKTDVECVDLLGVDDKSQTSLDGQISSPLKSSPNPEPAVQASNPVSELSHQMMPSPCETAYDTCPSKQLEPSQQKETKTSPRTSPKTSSEAGSNGFLMESAFSSASIKTQSAKSHNEKNDNDDESDNEVENEETTNKLVGPKSKKTTPTKKSKKKRKKGKK